MTSKLAVQMYTVRDFTKTEKGLADSLAKIRQIGYTAVQLSAVEAMSGLSPAVTAAQARRMLDNNGLACIATHREWDDLKDRTAQEVEFHRTLGCDFAAIGGIGRYRKQGVAGYRQFLQDAAPVIAQLQSAGIRFGYHNHEFEFARLGPGRQTFYDLLVEEGGPDLFLELDLYWADHAGVNPERLIERCAGRMPVIHLKDKEVVGSEPVMAPIGEGNMDWGHLLPACERAGVEWYAVEQDFCRRDPFDCLRSSFNFLSRLIK